MLASRVLIVDDDPNLREINRCFLEEAGYAVVEAETGKLAVQALLADAFDAVITDLRMPTASGEALIQWILLNRPAMRSRILIVTGDIMSPDLGAFIARTGLPLLPKPYERAQLLAAIRKVLDTSLVPGDAGATPN